MTDSDDRKVTGSGNYALRKRTLIELFIIYNMIDTVIRDIALINGKYIDCFFFTFEGFLSSANTYSDGRRLGWSLLDFSNSKIMVLIKS